MIVDSTSNIEIECAPIVIFVYKRIKHFERCVNSLKKNKLANNSELYVFCDGPKSLSELVDVSKVREYARKIDGFKKINVLESSVNKGLSKSIIDGINYVSKKHESFIVLEDDLEVSEFYLCYLNEALKLYSNTENIGAISGFSFRKSHVNRSSLFRLSSSWGWASWSNRWTLLQTNPNVLLSELKSQNLTEYFDVDGTYPSSKLLKDVINGKYDSWAILWDATLILNRLYTLFPPVSLVRNNGFDSTGSHCNNGQSYLNELYSSDNPSVLLDFEYETDEVVTEFKKTYKVSRLKKVIKLLIGRLI